MNALIRLLTRLGLLSDDLDYHLVRAALVLTFFLFGFQKWFPSTRRHSFRTSAMARSFSGSTRFLVSREPRTSLASSNGCWRCSSSSDSGTASWEFWALSAPV